MQQVAGMDGMFLSIDESQTASAVMGGLVVFDAAPDPEAGSLAASGRGSPSGSTAYRRCGG